MSKLSKLSLIVPIFFLIGVFILAPKITHAWWADNVISWWDMVFGNHQTQPVIPQIQSQIISHTNSSRVSATASSTSTSHASYYSPVYSGISQQQLDATLANFETNLTTQMQQYVASHNGTQDILNSIEPQINRIYDSIGKTVNQVTITTSAGSSSGSTNGNLSTLTVTGNATSTFAGGIDLASGCFSIQGVCITGGGGESLWTAGDGSISYNAGNVGIGTTSPAYNLEVAGNINFTGNLYQNGAPFYSGSQWNNINGGNISYDNGYVGIGTDNPWSALDVATSSAGQVPIITIESNFENDDQGPSLDFRDTNIPAPFPAARIQAVAYSPGGAGLAFDTNSGIWGDGGLGESMRITPFGDVGIGTSQPNATLHVVGKNNSFNNLFKLSNVIDQATTTQFMVDAFGHVGIGKSSSDYILDVAGDINFTGNLYQNGVLFSGGGSGLWTNNNDGTIYYNGGIFGNYFNATSTTATSTFAGNLDVGSGSLQYDNTSGITSITNLNIGGLTFDTNAGEVSFIDLPVTSDASQGTVESYSAQIGGNPLLTMYGESDGEGGVQNMRVGIATTSPAYALDVAGDIHAVGDICTDAGVACLASPSDARLKINITNLSLYDASSTILDKVLTFNPVTYRWNSLYMQQHPNSEDATSTQIGLVAQDVMKQFPELVHTTPNGYYVLDYTHLVAVAIEAIKELAVKVNNIYSGVADISTHSVSTQTLCVGDVGDQVCVTKDQLKALLQNQNITPASVVVSTPISTKTATTSIATSTDDSQVSSTPESIATSTPDTDSTSTASSTLL